MLCRSALVRRSSTLCLLLKQRRDVHFMHNGVVAQPCSHLVCCQAHHCRVVQVKVSVCCAGGCCSVSPMHG